MNTTVRRYPVGIQTFEKLRKEGYVYVDKTDLMWKMTRESSYIFLSRPRRFGKSLLSSTLRSYFEGRKDLFEGLKIMELEEEWEQYPVIHLDVSEAKNQPNAAELQNALIFAMQPWAQKYGKDDLEVTPGRLLKGLIRRAYEQTGKQVAVIIDEYDAPLLEVLHEEEMLPEYRRVMQELYQCLKPADPMLRFCFITGITKFSQLSIFSTINNLTNISLDDKYAAICGITEEEFATVRRHPAYGFEMMRQSAAEVHEGIKKGIMQHHERCDGSGYPEGLRRGEISPYGRLIAILDIYDAMAADRVYARRRSPFDIFKVLTEDMTAGRLDPEYTVYFMRQVCRSLIGNWVLLSNGDRGRIVYIAESRVTALPMVQTVHDEFIDLEQRKDIRVEALLTAQEAES